MLVGSSSGPATRDYDLALARRSTTAPPRRRRRLPWLVRRAGARRACRAACATCVAYGALLRRPALGLPAAAHRPLPRRSDPLTAIGPLPSAATRSRLEVERRPAAQPPHGLLPAAARASPPGLAGAVGGRSRCSRRSSTGSSTLVAGISPQSLHRFLAAYLRYQLHVIAFLYLVGNPFPGFAGAEGAYPIELRVAPTASARTAGRSSSA